MRDIEEKGVKNCLNVREVIYANPVIPGSGSTDKVFKCV